jgi:hypothetical protein
MDKAVEVSREELAVNLLKRANDEIRQLRQTLHHQGAQLLVFEKIAKIAGWQDQPYGESPDISWEIDRFITPRRLSPIPEAE